jgi:hypothetical protein
VHVTRGKRSSVGGVRISAGAGCPSAEMIITGASEFSVVILASWAGRAPAQTPPYFD